MIPFSISRKQATHRPASVGVTQWRSQRPSQDGTSFQDELQGSYWAPNRCILSEIWRGSWFWGPFASSSSETSHRLRKNMFLQRPNQVVQDPAPGPGQGPGRGPGTIFKQFVWHLFSIVWPQILLGPFFDHFKTIFSPLFGGIIRESPKPSFDNFSTTWFGRCKKKFLPF